MSRFTQSSSGGSQGPQGPTGPQGPAGTDANTADFTFAESTMSTNGDMDISVLGVPGEINLSAYAGVNIQTSAEFGLTTNKIITTSNGATDNIKIGDDAYIGDGNIANNIAIVGQQDATQGGIVLGSNETEQISTDGSNLNIEADNDIILYPGSSYAYLGTPQIDGSNRIATVGNVGTGEVVRWSPNFQATGLTFTGTNGTYPTYNSHYVKNGRMVSFNIEVDMSTVTNFGTGQYKLQLPFTPQFGFNHFSGWVWADPNVDPDTGTGHTILNADTAGVTDVLDLHYLKQSGGANSPIREGLFLQGTPVTLSTISKIYVNGTYITSS